MVDTNIRPAYVEYHQNIISKDQYTNWKLNWPNSCDSTQTGHVDWRRMDM
jgi:hypothetical protein